MFGMKTDGFMSTGEAEAYFDGAAAGIRCFAWWRDGTQYVGTTGTSLASALDELDAARATALKRFASEPELEPQAGTRHYHKGDDAKEPAKHGKDKKK